MDKKKSLLLLTVAAAAGSVIYNIWKPVRTELPVVENFNLDRYLGTWYEIARMDFFWERGLKNVTAAYDKNEDGTIRVNNQGTKIKKNEHIQSIGKAKPLGSPNRGALKVSFFGPFYSGYNVMHVDENYQYALVFGENLDYMWILSRHKDIPQDIKNKYLDYARQAGYRIEDLTWTIQE